MGRSFKVLAILVLATFAVSACGKRGVLEPPKAEDEAAPNPKTLRDVTQSHGRKGQSLSGRSSTVDPAEGVRPDVTEAEHRPFVLDGLLR